MNEKPSPDAADTNETPMQRALRLKKAAQTSHPSQTGPRGKVNKANAVAPTGKSRPWMTR